MKSLGFLDGHCQVNEHRDVRAYGGRREAFVSPPVTSSLVRSEAPGSKVCQ